MNAAPPLPPIPHSRPWIVAGDDGAVADCVRSRYLGDFRKARELEAALVTVSGLSSCRLYASGTLALRAALCGLGLPAGAGVAVTALACPDVGNAIQQADLVPVLYDCGPTGLLRRDALMADHASGRISAVVAIHQFGLVEEEAAPLTPLLPVIEDCSHVPPRRYLSGSRTVIGSMEATKLIGAGEGGYLLSDVPLDGLGVDIGAGLSDLVAQLALRQIQRLDGNLARRSRFAARFARALPAEMVLDGIRAGWFRFVLRLRDEDQVRFGQDLASGMGISVWRPLALYHGVENGSQIFADTESLWRRLLSIPLYPDLSESEIDRILDLVHGVFAYRKERE